MSTHHGIFVHAVFSTKYRKKTLKAVWRDELYAYIGGIVRDHKSVLIQSGCVEDHIHLLLKVHPEFAIAKTVQLLKTNSSKWINEQRKTSSKFQWQRGHGVFAVSQSKVATVKQYIATQEQHHALRTFEEEYVLMLRRHGIDYDPRFVFEREFVA